MERIFLYEFIIGKNIFNFVATSVEILYVELFPEFGCFLVEMQLVRGGGMIFN